MATDASGGDRRHRVRIVGGRWRRTPLAVADVDGLRPTPDRVRETLFNWLGQRLDGLRCLDLFAGTGVLGIEAASRGAAQVRLVERDRRAARAIRESLARLDAREVELVEADALAELDAARRAGERFDLVFLDPPFHAGWLPRVLPLLPAVLARDAQVYVESEAPLPVLAPAVAEDFELLRADKAGQVHYHLLRTRGERAPAGQPDGAAARGEP